ncbi:MAG: ATP-binding protein [Porticoccus sp.]|nr:ATP-binding protein [Porticoccus sp.]
MKSLFWKIFVSFWLALILFASLTLWATSHYLEKVRSETSNLQPRNNTIEYIRQARALAQGGDIKALRHWLTQLDEREAIPYLLLDESGKDLLNRPVPLHLQHRTLRLERKYLPDEHENEHDDEHRHRRPHQRPIIINGQRYRLMPDFQNITLNRVLNRPRVIATPFLLAALISAIICLLLARYLTAPIGRLRQATQKLAQGDLNQRVSPSMGNRKDEIVELANDFDYMAEQLQALIESHKQLLRDASHELRSPLARLQVALGLARQRGDNESTQELDRIEREAERLNELIGQLLSLARLETNTADIELKPIELDALLENIVDDAAYESRAVNRDVKIIHSMPVTIKGNSVLLSSALENVIRNAIRYTAESTWVEVSLQSDSEKPGWVEIKIRDHGPGIPQQMLESIFEPFVRVGEARDRQSGGYGLGLAIAKRAVNLHGGKMTAANEKDGLNIIIHLPVNDS